MLLDTNVIIEHFRLGILEELSDKDIVYISVITEAELLRYSAISSTELRYTENLLLQSNIISVDSMIARTAAHLGRTRKTKLPDLLIAATAIVLDVPLVTYNSKDFRNIPKLRFYTPQGIFT